MNHRYIRIAARQGSALRKCDVVILGATFAGCKAAMAAAGMGKKTCLLEPGMTLGVELSRFWNPAPPSGELGQRLETLCRQAGVAPAEFADIFTGALAFDRILAETDVDCLVRVQPMRPLTGKNGGLEGVEVVGRSGRQAVLAPIVIDALPGRPFARRGAGLPPAALAGIRRRLYVAGLTAAAPAVWPVDASLGLAGDRVRVTPASWEGEALIHFELENHDGRALSAWSQASLSRAAGLMAWLRKHRPECANASLVDVSPAPEPVFTGPEPDWSPLRDTGLAALPEAETPAVALADVWEPAMAARAPLPRPAAVEPCEKESLHPRELAADPIRDLPPCTLPETHAVLHEPADVLVAGYGTGGAIAALAAAAEDVSVAVLDPAHVPGGIGTAGRIHSYYHGIDGGLQQRIDEAMNGKAAAIAEDVRGYHPVAKAVVLAEAFAQKNPRAFPGYTAIGVILENNATRGVLAAAADGYHVFPAQMVIDATGDGDVCAAAGAPMTLGREGDGFPQPYSYTPSLMRNGVLHHSNFDAGWVDPTDTLDFSRAHFEGRDRLWQRGPFTPENHFCTLASVLGIRESRFIEGDPSLTFADFMEGRDWPDTVCSAFAHYDNHAMDYAEESEWGRRHVVLFGLWRFTCDGRIPYRALLPRGIDNLLVGCRALAVNHDLHQLVRMQRDIQVFGEISGLAAARAVKQGCSPRALDTDELRRRLEERGIVSRPPKAVMDVPPDELFAALGADDQERGLAMWRLSLRPHGLEESWSRFFAAESGPEARFAGAVAAALGGYDLAPVREILEATIRERVADPRLGIKSPPKFVVACLALVALGTPGIGATIGELLADRELAAPDLLLLLRALADTRDPDAGRIVRDFLDARAGDDFRIPLWGVASGAPTSFRPAIVLRAARTLVDLGEKSVREYLEPYLHHQALLIRRYARRIAADAEALPGN